MKTSAYLVFALSALAVNAYSVPGAKNADSSTLGRRQAFGSIFGASVAFLAAPLVNALDMDSFVNSQLENDKKNCNPKYDPKCVPQLTKDEALCKYGQSGNARGEACARVKKTGGELPSAKPQGKSLGGAYAM